MRTYQNLRQQWISELTASGELERLSLQQRRMLESGSLHVLAATQLEHLERQRAFVRTAARLVGGALLFCLLYVGVASLTGDLWVESAVVENLMALGWVLLATIPVVLLHTFVSRRVDRRKGVYAHLRETASVMLRALYY